MLLEPVKLETDGSEPGPVYQQLAGAVTVTVTVGGL